MGKNIADFLIEANRILKTGCVHISLSISFALPSLPRTFKYQIIADEDNWEIEWEWEDWKEIEN